MKGKLPLIKYFLFIYIASYAVFNWADISWMFNYHTAGGFLEELVFGKEVAVAQNTTEAPAPADSGQAITGNIYEKTDKPDGIEIPKLDISAPLILSDSIDNEELEKDLKLGVVHYPDSAAPGENGQAVILGHSAGPTWPHIYYDWVFSHLDSLEPGDKIFVYYNGQKITYEVKSKTILEKGGEVPSYDRTKANLLLLSCWPPGSNTRRIAISAEVVSN